MFIMEITIVLYPARKQIDKMKEIEEEAGTKSSLNLAIFLAIQITLNIWIMARLNANLH